MRKTVSVDEVRVRANAALAARDSFTRDGIDTKSQRWGVIFMIESILHATGNYHGYQYLDSEFAAPGVFRNGYDDTRRRYF